MKKKPNISSLLFIISFILILVSISLATTFAPIETYSYYENRNLAGFPKMNTESVLSGQWGADMDKYLTDHAAWREQMMIADTVINMYLLKQPLVNDVIIAEDCLLPVVVDWKTNTSYITEDAISVTNNILSAKEATESYGGSYFCVAVPCQYVFYNDKYPWYVNNREAYTRLSLEALSQNMQQAGISFLDVGKKFEDMGWPEYLASAIDNHFSIYGAYLTYVQMMERILAETDYDLDMLEEGEYRITELPNPYLGANARKLLDLWPHEEHLGILEPNTPIPFIRKDNHQQVASTVYSLPEDSREDVLYSVYMGGDIGLTEIDTGREELPSILIYGDSFTNAVECIAYYSFDKMYSIDQRHYTENTLEEFIAQHQPEIVVCIKDYEGLMYYTGE